MPFRLRVSFAILLGLFSLGIIGPLITPIRPLTDTVSARDLADDDSQFISLNGLDVHYKTAGDSDSQDTFLLLHGFGANTYTWHELMPELAKEGFVVAFDRPAFGLTDRPLSWDAENPYGPEAQLNLILSLIDTLNLDSVTLIGHSAGGAIAAEFALKQPEKVKRLVLLDATIYSAGGPPAWSRPLLYSPQMTRMGPIFMRQFSGEPGDKFLQSAWFNPDNIDDETRLAYEQNVSIHDWDKALWELSKASRPPNIAQDLKTIGLPSLVITGLEDIIVPARFSQQLAQDLGNASLIELQDCGHVPQEECPSALSSALTEWLKENP